MPECRGVGLGARKLGSQMSGPSCLSLVVLHLCQGMGQGSGSHGYWVTVSLNSAAQRCGPKRANNLPHCVPQMVLRSCSLPLGCLPASSPGVGQCLQGSIPPLKLQSSNPTDCKNSQISPYHFPSQGFGLSVHLFQSPVCPSHLSLSLSFLCMAPSLL